MPHGRKVKARRTKKRSSSATPSLESPKKQLKRSNENMELAMDAVIQGAELEEQQRSTKYLEQHYKIESNRRS